MPFQKKNVIFVYFEPWTFNILFYAGYYALTYLISRLQCGAVTIKFSFLWGSAQKENTINI